MRLGARWALLLAMAVSLVGLLGLGLSSPPSVSVGSAGRGAHAQSAQNTATPDESALATPTPSPTVTSTSPPTAGPQATATPKPSPTPSPPPSGPIAARVLQVWPDQAVGIASQSLSSVDGSDKLRLYPFGVARSGDGAVRARTYLHFPLDVFPPGSDVLSADLYVYVDSGTDDGAATFGVYRVLEGWVDWEWDEDPASWPEVLDSPLAVEELCLEANGVSGGDSSASPLPTPPSQPPADSGLTLEPAEGTWLRWDVTALVRAWLAGDVPGDGMALAAGPDPGAGPAEARDLIVARWLTVDDPATRPYLIADVEIYPVTPTPVPTPVPILPRAGSGSTAWGAVLFLLFGAAALAVGWAVRRRSV